MKILVVDFAASTGGALSILRDYYEDAKKDKINEYVFLLHDRYIEETENIKIIVLRKQKKWLNRLVFDYISGRKMIKKINPDIVFSLQNTIVRGIDKKQILYVHQPIPFQKEKNFSIFKKRESKLAIYQLFIAKIIKNSIKHADQIIVQTEWMKNEIIKQCCINEDKILKIYPKIKEIEYKKIRKMDSNKKCMFFYPASNIVYKNHEIIYKAISILEKEEQLDYEIRLTIKGEDTEKIKYLGNIDREKVFEEYLNDILIFPSYIETYGLPLAEARMCNSIILASDTSFSHEILNDYPNAYFFNPFKPEELAELIKKCIKEKLNTKKI